MPVCAREPTIGNQLRRYRESRDISLYEAAQLTGVRKPSLSNLDIYTSFTSESNKIGFGYFLGKGVCERVLVSRATNKKIFINKPLGMEEFEVIDVATKDTYIEILSFDEWLIKYPEYSKGFGEYFENHSRNAIIPILLSSELTEEELEIKNIMNSIIEGLSSL